MKIIRKKNLETKHRPDGRKVMYYPPLDIPPNTSKIGLLMVDTPKNCKDTEHMHPISTEIFYHLTPGKVYVNGEIHDLDAGDVIILEPGDKHKQLAPDNDIKLVILRIPQSNDKEIVK